MVADGVLGPALAVVATRLLGGLLFEVDALGPLTFLGMRSVLGVAALLTAYVPARRASRAIASPRSGSTEHRPAVWSR